MRFTILLIITVLLLITFNLATAQLEGPFEPDDHTTVLFHCDEGEGDVLTDATDNEYDMQLNEDADWTEDGMFDTALDLTADGSAVTSDLTIGTGWDEITVEAWIKVDHFLEDDIEPIVSRYEWYTHAAFYFCVYYEGALWGGVYTTGGQGDYPQALSDEGLIEPGEWYHVAMTWSSGDELVLWLNGERVASAECPGGTIRNSPDRLTIGYHWNNGRYPDDYFFGYIDEVRISNTVRDFNPPEPEPRVVLSEGWDDGNWNENPEWVEYNPDDEPDNCFVIVEVGHEESPCAEVRHANHISYTALYTSMNCGCDFDISLWIHKRTETFSIFQVGVCQGEYSRDNRGVTVVVNYHNEDHNWYLNHWDWVANEGEHNETQIEYPDDWMNLIMSRDEDGQWTVTWDPDGDNESTIDFQDSFEELDDPHIYWSGGGYYDIEGGSYLDDIVVTEDAPIIAVSSDTLDFGEVEIDGDGRGRELTISNDGNLDLTVSDISVEGDFFSVDFDDELVIEPAEEEIVSVVFSPGEEGEFDESLTISSNDPENPEVVISLLGKGITSDAELILSESWDDGNWNENPEWIEYHNDDRCFAIIDTVGHNDNPCAEVRGGNIGTDYTALFTPMNCGEEFTIDLWIHQRTETFSVFKVGVCQGEYSSDNRGVEVRINYHDMDGNWYLCYWDHDGEAHSHNEIRIEYDADRWANLVISRDEEGNWTVIWDKDGDNEHTTEFEDTIEELTDPKIWWGGGGYYGNQGGSYLDDIEVWGVSDQIIEPDLSLNVPQNYVLTGVFPNPFNARTVIHYSITEPSQISLNIYDIFGREVSRIYDGSCLPGSYSATFNAHDLPSGLYLIRLETGYRISTAKVALVR